MPKACTDEPRLLAEIDKLVKENPRRGYRFITACLRRQGWRINVKRVHRLWRKEGFKVPKRSRNKRAVGDGTNACNKKSARARNDVWAWDFVHDRTVDGRQLKFLVIIDEFTRECLCLEVGRSFQAEQVLDELAKCMARHGVPAHIRSDNGSEFIAEKLRAWLIKAGVKTLYIEAGAPWQNGYVESFNSRFRDECLEMNYFHTMSEARYLARIWMDDYNTKRPHMSLGYLTPQEFAKQSMGASFASPCSASQSPMLCGGHPQQP